MDMNLREHFDRAVSDDPGFDPGDMAHAAIAGGRRMRRRRGQMVAAGVAAGVVTVLGAVAGLNQLSEPPRPRSSTVTIAAAMMPVAAPSCSVKPVDRDATDVVIFLTAGVTDRQQSALKSALADDARVHTLQFENRGEAYQRFRMLWANNPDLVAAVSADQFPESFRLRLADASKYDALRTQYAAMDGVELIIGRICQPSAPVGGIL